MLTCSLLKSVVQGLSAWYAVVCKMANSQITELATWHTSPKTSTASTLQNTFWSIETAVDYYTGIPETDLIEFIAKRHTFAADICIHSNNSWNQILNRRMEHIWNHNHGISWKVPSNCQPNTSITRLISVSVCGLPPYKGTKGEKVSTLVPAKPTQLP